MKRTVLFIVLLTNMVVGMAQGTGLKSCEEVALKTMHHGFKFDCRMNEEHDVIFKVFKRGKLFRKFNVGYVYLGDEKNGNEHVKFVDVNFDGYADYLIGMDFPRYGMAVVLYNPSKRTFEWSDDWLLQSPLFDTQNRVVYSMAANGAAQKIVNKFVPYKNGLKKVETIRVTFEKDLFNENSDPEFRVKNTYEFIDANENRIKGCDSPEQLTKNWRDVLDAYGLTDLEDN